MDEIIVIRAADPDGSIFKAIVNALKGKRAEVVHINAPASSVLRIGKLEIDHEHRLVLMAGREVRLNHGEYAILYCMASSPGQVFSKAQLYADVFPNGFVKEEIILGNIADLTHELSKRNIANILPAKTDCSGGRIPKTGHQLGNRGLAGARWADNSGHGTGLRRE